MLKFVAVYLFFSIWSYLCIRYGRYLERENKDELDVLRRDKYDSKSK